MECEYLDYAEHYDSEGNYVRIKLILIYTRFIFR